MNFKQIVQDYFTFSRNERKGITILLVIIFLLAIVNKVIFYFETPAKIDVYLLDTTRNEPYPVKNGLKNPEIKTKLFKFNLNTIDPIALDSLDLPGKIKNNILKFREKGGRFYSSSDFKKMYGVTDSVYNKLLPFLLFEEKSFNSTPHLEQSVTFIFDPNTATDNDFMRLGLSEKQIKTIRNYQGKGGTFRSKSDFQKLYGISDSQKNTLTEFIRIEGKSNDPIPNQTPDFSIEINATDSIELMRLPGIGSKLSQRIIKYRDLLGGFFDAAQLKEVYGLNAQLIQQIEGKITIDPKKIRKVNINFADFNELAKHPYIRKELAKKIIKFRTKFGSIHESTVLQDSMILNMDEYTKLKPYL